MLPDLSVFVLVVNSNQFFLDRKSGCENLRRKMFIGSMVTACSCPTRGRQERGLNHSSDVRMPFFFKTQLITSVRSSKSPRIKLQFSCVL